MREDYSESGDAWNYFTHDQARSRAYRWGEDGLAGISDDKQRLCFSLALWNGKDPILKERLFGLTNSESNHGEDVKEYYFYLDSTPTHSYMKYLYKYPQEAYPYHNLVETSRRRGRNEFEYELIDTGVFDQDRYFDVFVEYAKASPEDILIQITVCNRGPQRGQSCMYCPRSGFGIDGPGRQSRSGRLLSRLPKGRTEAVVKACDPELGERYLYCEGDTSCCLPRTKPTRSGSSVSLTGVRMSKTASTTTLSTARKKAVNPQKKGTKMSADYRLTINPGECRTVRLRLSGMAPEAFGSKANPPVHSGAPLMN